MKRIKRTTTYASGGGTPLGITAVLLLAAAALACEGAEKGTSGRYGESCLIGADCVTGLCVNAGPRSVCSRACDAVACPTGDKCTALSWGKVCFPSVGGITLPSADGSVTPPPPADAGIPAPDLMAPDKPVPASARGKFCNALSKGGSSFSMTLELGSGSTLVRLSSYSGVCTSCRNLPVGYDIPFTLYDDDTGQWQVRGTFTNFAKGEQLIFLSDLDSSSDVDLEAYTLKPGVTCESYKPW